MYKWRLTDLRWTIQGKLPESLQMKTSAICFSCQQSLTLLVNVGFLQNKFPPSQEAIDLLIYSSVLNLFENCTVTLSTVFDL